MIFKIVRMVHTSYKKFVVCLSMYIITPQEGANKDASAIPTSGQSVQKPGQPGNGAGPLPGRSEPHNGGELFQKIGQGPPQLFIVPLQRLDLLRVNTAVGVRLDRHLV